MNSNLRVTTGMGGCFSSAFLHYAIALQGFEPGGALVAYAFIDRTPELIGTASATYEDAAAHIDEVLRIVAMEDPPPPGRSTTTVQVEIGWDVKGKQDVVYLSDSAELSTNDVKRRSHLIYDCCIRFVEKRFPGHPIWEHFFDPEA